MFTALTSVLHERSGAVTLGGMHTARGVGGYPRRGDLQIDNSHSRGSYSIMVGVVVEDGSGSVDLKLVTIRCDSENGIAYSCADSTYCTENTSTRVARKL